MGDEWVVGPLSHRGEDNGGIFSNGQGSSQCPFDIDPSNWKYFDGSSIVLSDASAISIVCKNECLDVEEYSGQCPDWANKGECDANSDFMLVQCPKSCGACRGVADEMALCPKDYPFALENGDKCCKTNNETCEDFKDCSHPPCFSNSDEMPVTIEPSNIEAVPY